MQYNDQGALVHPSFDSAHSRQTVFYCGRRVGNVGYHNPCGTCDGRCGPTNGCQCKSCYRLTFGINRYGGHQSLAVTQVQPQPDEFREIAVLICSGCGYLEFPGCRDHALLSFRGQTGSMECAHSGCPTDASSWRKCRLCSTPRPNLYCWRLRCQEAHYSKKNIQNDLVVTCLLICPDCKAFEFPGTSNGLVKVSLSPPAIMDYATNQTLSVSNWANFTHFTPGCRGHVQPHVVVLSRTEADYASKKIESTPKARGHDIEDDMVRVLADLLFDAQVTAYDPHQAAGSGHTIRLLRSEREFRELHSSNPGKLVVVDFFWKVCKPCVMLAPELEKLAKANPGCVFAKIEKENCPTLLSKEDINAFPTVGFYKDGRLVSKTVGFDLDSLRSNLKNHGTSAVSHQAKVEFCLPGEHGKGRSLDKANAEVLNGLVDENDVTINKSSRDNYLGKGGFGEVWKGRFHGSQVACKMVRSDLLDASSEREFMREISLLMHLDHARVVNYIGLTFKSGTWILIQELCVCSLDAALTKPRVKQDDNLRHRMLLDAALGVKYLHDQGVIHFDLKPGNLLVDSSDRVKVADFGLATAASKVTGVKQACGTPLYMAPELFQSGMGTLASDVFSFGIIAFEVFSLERPYAERHFTSVDDIKRVVLGGGRPRLPDRLVGGRRQKIVDSCLLPRPQSRVSIGSLASQIQDLVR